MEEVDEDFEKELAALLADFKLPPSGPFPEAAASLGLPSGQEGPDSSSTVSFRVMMKRGGRDDRSKAVQVWPAGTICVRSCSPHVAVQTSLRLHLHLEGLCQLFQRQLGSPWLP